MKITIHRGSNQIGGCITEIATDSTRIFIDFGQNLPDNKGMINDKLNTSEAVAKLTEGVSAIIYTHYHGDHVGLFHLVPNRVKQYIGEVALKVMITKYSYIEKGIYLDKLNSFETFRSGHSFLIGKDIRITPYFVSHSACDSNMLLIETDGKRILHTGDFRNHGYLGKGLAKVIKAYVGQVDVLITEGTMLSRGNERVRHESQLKQDFIDLMKQYKNCFVVCSSTDLERLATIHAAHKETKPTAPFICDEYQKKVLDIFSNSAGKQSELFSFDDAITFESRQANIWKNGFTILVRCSHHFDCWTDKLLAKINMDKTVIVFSMWGEYINPLSRHAKKEYLDFISKFKNIKKIHTSGHASKESLTEVCTLTNPALAIIPIHCERSDNYLSLPLSEELKLKVILQSCSIGKDDIEIVQ